MMQYTDFYDQRLYGLRYELEQSEQGNVKYRLKWKSQKRTRLRLELVNRFIEAQRLTILEKRVTSHYPPNVHGGGVKP